MAQRPGTEAEKVVIIGGGPAGLATAACLRRVGAPCVVLEQAPQLASAWRNHYDRLHLHTTKAASALPHLAFPRDIPRYPSREQVVAYLDAYAAHFHIEPVLGTQVRALRREGDKWVTETADGSFRSRDVVVATGITRVPSRPSWPGQASFAGAVLHSSEYRNGAAFRGRRVLVVGLGNSGGEIALDLLEHGAHPALSVRGPVNVVPREFLGLSMAAWARVLQRLPLGLADVIGRAVAHIAFGRLAPLGLRRLPYGPMTEIRRHGKIPLIDVGTIAAVRSGSIAVLPAVESFSAAGARFVDGSERPFDAVVLATGYRPQLQQFLAEQQSALDAAGAPRRSGAETLPGLYFCGFHVVPTGMFREIAREARAIARSIVARR